MKNSVLDNYPLCPPAHPPPLKSANFIFIVVSLSLSWAAANGGVTNGGFKGCLAALPGNRLKSAFSALFLPFSPFSGGCEEHLGNPENGGKMPFSLDILRFA